MIKHTDLLNTLIACVGGLGLIAGLLRYVDDWREKRKERPIEFSVLEAMWEAQTRMSRTIVAAQALGVDLNTETRTWVMSDNSIEQVTIAELAEALRRAGDEQTALWTILYTESE